MKVYFMENVKEEPQYEKGIFLDKERCKEWILADMYVYDADRPRYYLASQEVKFVPKYLCYTLWYMGYDYSWDFSGMRDVCKISKLYPSINHCKNDEKWKSMYKSATENPSEYNITDLKICSKDDFGDDWIYGDVMEGKQRIDIHRVKVQRRFLNDEQRENVEYAWKRVVGD